MRLYSIPYYIDLEGKTVNGIELKSYHVKLLGVLTVHDKFGNGCFASTELLAEEAKLTVGTVEHARADLVNAGIITVERGDNNSVKSIYVNDVVFQGVLNHSSTGFEPQFKRVLNHSSKPNREATPVLNKRLNKNNKVLACGSDDIKELDETSSDPFDEKVDEVVSLKPGNKNKENAQAWAIAKEMVKVLGHDEREARVTGVGKNVRSLMGSGYTKEDFINLAEWAKDSDFYKEKPLRTILNADAMQQSVLAASKKQSSCAKQDGNDIFKDKEWTW